MAERPPAAVCPGPFSEVPRRRGGWAASRRPRPYWQKWQSSRRRLLHMRSRYIGGPFGPGATSWHA
eukprot:15143672-Alexandrium_andersonii.AAC.1